MKTATLGLLSLLTAAMPMAVSAQVNIRSAFKKIIECKDAEIKESRFVERNPQSNIITGKSEVYSFELPAGKKKLLEKAIAAFAEDAGKAYTIKSGSSDEESIPILLAVGNSNAPGVPVTEPGTEYMYSCFLAPDTVDLAGNYRFALGLNYKEEDGKIIGKLMETFATTLQYRQYGLSYGKYKTFEGGQELANILGDNKQMSWFEQLMAYFGGIETSPNSKTRIGLAAKSYTLIKNHKKYPDVTPQDCNAVREILKELIPMQDPIVKKILQQCLVALK